MNVDFCDLKVKLFKEWTAENRVRLNSESRNGWLINNGTVLSVSLSLE